MSEGKHYGGGIQRSFRYLEERWHPIRWAGIKRDIDGNKPWDLRASTHERYIEHLGCVARKAFTDCIYKLSTREEIVSGMDVYGKILDVARYVADHSTDLDKVFQERKHPSLQECVEHFRPDCLPRALIILARAIIRWEIDIPLRDYGMMVGYAWEYVICPAAQDQLGQDELRWKQRHPSPRGHLLVAEVPEGANVTPTQQIDGLIVQRSWQR
ncbi:hypothetical protein LTR17_019979 [Elasticomyces elasticus]|nr:hypothetical protein LTR17_019979 [Elasticomyces elasticus]